MVETIKGEGRLETITPPEKVWMVSYHFDITTKVVEKPGFPRVALSLRTREIAAVWRIPALEPDWRKCR
jgi:hypothetical protein